jgi:hypothetical protein
METTVIPSVNEYSNDLKLVNLRFDGTSLFSQTRIGESVAILNVAATNLRNSRGQGGEFQVDADLIAFDRVYSISTNVPMQIEVFVKPTKLTVDERES